MAQVNKELLAVIKRKCDMTEARTLQKVKRLLSTKEDIVEYPKDRTFDIKSKFPQFESSFNEYVQRLNRLLAKMHEILKAEGNVMDLEHHCFIVEAYRRCRGNTLYQCLDQFIPLGHLPSEKIEESWQNQQDVLHALIKTADTCPFTYVTYLKQYRSQIHQNRLHYRLSCTLERAEEYFRSVIELDEVGTEKDIFAQFIRAEYRGMDTHSYGFAAEIFKEVYPDLSEKDLRHYIQHVLKTTDTSYIDDALNRIAEASEE